MRPLRLGRGVSPHFSHVETAIGVPGQGDRADNIRLGRHQFNRQIGIGEVK